MQTTNNNIKIVRLQSGEDIIADYVQTAEEEDTVMLDNPMHIIFKRIPSGQTIMMMMPWLPIELIKDNSAVIYTSDILTIIEPKEDLVKYYGDVVIEAHQRMEKNLPFYDEEEVEEDDEEEDFNIEDMIESMKAKKKGNLH